MQLRSVLAVSLVVLAGALSGGRSLASDWVQASSYADAEGKWVSEPSAYDLNTSSYSTDQSNRLGWGAVLKLNYATPVLSDRVRVTTDFGYSTVDKVRLTVTYSDDSTATMEYDGTVVHDVTASTLTFNQGLVKSVEYSFHYLRTGFYWWLYDLQLYQCPAAPAPLSGTTLAPSSINATSAVLHGKVVSNGGAPCYGRFVYWKSPETRLYTAWRSDLGNNQEFTAAVSGLDEGAGYAYQAQLAATATPAEGEIVACEPASAFTTVKINETSSVEWVSPSLAWADAGTWESAEAAMDDDTTTSARCYHQIDADSWSPFVHYSTDLQSNGIRIWAPATNVDMVDIDILKGGAWQNLYQGLFTGSTWQQFPFEKGQVTEARIRLHVSASYLGVYWNLAEVDFHQKDELRTTRYFVGPGSDWSSAANWSATSGGAGGASVPGTGSVAIFDANSPNCTLSANISVEVLRLEAGFAGVLDAGTKAITIERNRGFGELKVAGGELKLGSATHTIKDNLRVVGGAITPGASTVGFLAPNDGSFEIAGSVGLNNVRFYHSNSGSNHKVVVINGTVTANGSLALEGYSTGGWHLYLNGGEIVAKGAINGNGRVVRGSSSLTVSGSAGDQTQTNLCWGTSGTYTVDKPAGKLVFAGDERFGDPTTSANAQTKLVLATEVDAVSAQPTVWLCGYGYGGVKVTGDLAAYDLTFYRDGGTGTTVYDIAGTVTVINNLDLDMTADGGWHVNFASGGTIECKGNATTTCVTGADWSGATLRVSGTGDQVVDLGGLKIASLVISKPSGALTFVGGFYVVGLLQVDAGASIIFSAGITYISESLALNGESTKLITLRSNQEGVAWKLNVFSPYATASYVDVRDSDASEGRPICTAESINSGNNTNWQFVDFISISTPASSITSPAWVEGQIWGPAAEVSATVDGEESVVAARLGWRGWYLNTTGESAIGVRLLPDVGTHVEIATADASGRAKTAFQDITWQPTVLTQDSGQSVTIRKGDALLLTAYGTGTLLEIDQNGDGEADFSGLPGEMATAGYEASGTFTAIAKIDGEEIGSLTIHVVDVDLTAPIACQVGYKREKNVAVVPATQSQTVHFQPSDPDMLTVSVKSYGAEVTTLYLTPLHRGRQQLVARLGGSTGPIISLRKIDEFTLDIPARVSLVADLATHEAFSSFTMQPYIPDLDITLNMCVHQSRFLHEGEERTSLTVSTSDDDLLTRVFDETKGEFVARVNLCVYIPPGEHGYCFTSQVTQQDDTRQTVSDPALDNGIALVEGVDLDIDSSNKHNVEANLREDEDSETNPGKLLKLGAPREKLILRYTKKSAEDRVELRVTKGGGILIYDTETGWNSASQFVAPDDNNEVTLWVQTHEPGEAVVTLSLLRYAPGGNYTKVKSDEVRIVVMPAEGLAVVPRRGLVAVGGAVTLRSYKTAASANTPENVRTQWRCVPVEGHELTASIAAGFNMVNGIWTRQEYVPSQTYLGVELLGLRDGDIQDVQVEAKDEPSSLIATATTGVIPFPIKGLYQMEYSARSWLIPSDISTTGWEIELDIKAQQSLIWLDPDRADKVRMTGNGRDSKAVYPFKSLVRVLGKASEGVLAGITVVAGADRLDFGLVVSPLAMSQTVDEPAYSGGKGEAPDQPYGLLGNTGQLVALNEDNDISARDVKFWRFQWKTLPRHVAGKDYIFVKCSGSSIPGVETAVRIEGWSPGSNKVQALFAADGANAPPTVVGEWDVICHHPIVHAPNLGQIDTADKIIRQNLARPSLEDEVAEDVPIDDVDSYPYLRKLGSNGQPVNTEYLPNIYGKDGKVSMEIRKLQAIKMRAEYLFTQLVDQTSDPLTARNMFMFDASGAHSFSLQQAQSLLGPLSFRCMGPRVNLINRLSEYHGQEHNKIKCSNSAMTRALRAIARQQLDMALQCALKQRVSLKYSAAQYWRDVSRTGDNQYDDGIDYEALLPGHNMLEARWDNPTWWFVQPSAVPTLTELFGNSSSGAGNWRLSHPYTREILKYMIAQRMDLARAILKEIGGPLTLTADIRLHLTTVNVPITVYPDLAWKTDMFYVGDSGYKIHEVYNRTRSNLVDTTIGYYYSEQAVVDPNQTLQWLAKNDNRDWVRQLHPMSCIGNRRNMEFAFIHAIHEAWYLRWILRDLDSGQLEALQDLRDATGTVGVHAIWIGNKVVMLDALYAGMFDRDLISNEQLNLSMSERLADIALASVDVIGVAVPLAKGAGVLEKGGARILKALGPNAASQYAKDAAKAGLSGLVADVRAIAGKTGVALERACVIDVTDGLILSKIVNADEVELMRDAAGPLMDFEIVARRSVRGETLVAGQAVADQSKHPILSLVSGAEGPMTLREYAAFSRLVKQEMKALYHDISNAELRDLVRHMCFESGTPVTMGDGSQKMIEDVSPGDNVLSRHESGRGQICQATVVQTLVRTVNSIRVLKFKPVHVAPRARAPHINRKQGRDSAASSDDGEGASSDEDAIRTTDDHPFWVVDQGWTPASELRRGAVVLADGGIAVCTDSVRQDHPEGVRVYNLTVANTHTYFVGKASIWVHNSCGAYVTFRQFLQLAGQGAKYAAYQIVQDPKALYRLIVRHNGFLGFTEKNFRKNLARHLGARTLDFEAHHVLTKRRFREIAERFGLHVHDPRFGAWWARQQHQDMIWLYDSIVETWLDENLTASADNFLDFLQDLASGIKDPRINFPWTRPTLPL